MINRELIRLKAVQIAYAHQQNEGQSIDGAEKELFESLSRSYDLYHHLLLLMVEIHRLGERAAETAQRRAQRLGDSTPVNTRFADNRLMLKLRSNNQLCDFMDNRRRHDWSDDEEFVRVLYQRVVDSTYYKDYMEAEESTFESDREFWRQVYRHILCNNEALDSFLEDQDLYWNDDRFIIDTFVLKTIRQYPEEAMDDYPLLPDYKSEEDREFARELIHQSLSGASYYRSLIAGCTHGWDVERVAIMDIIIMQTALAEIVTFPGIPLSVSINEYVEIAKMYSPPKSARYVNATLDAIAKRLKDEHKLVK